MKRRRLSVEAYVDGVRAGDRSVLAQAITLVESRHPDDRPLAGQVLAALPSATSTSVRLGVSGVPGAGKSTFIEALGWRRAEAGDRVAVLAVDPTSHTRGGSILGDKTRMSQLSHHPRAYVRPSPTRGHLGGVARQTRETIHLVEAAGFDLVLVETVGVGQSEVAVAELVDTVLLLLLPGAGDELQGIKRGILEAADVMALHKADGARKALAESARRELVSALAVLRGGEQDAWHPPVLTCSSLDGSGLGEVWEAVLDHRVSLGEAGLRARRRKQAISGLRSAVEQALFEAFRSDAAVSARWSELEREVAEGELPATVAADRLVTMWSQGFDPA